MPPKRAPEKDEEGEASGEGIVAFLQVWQAEQAAERRQRHEEWQAQVRHHDEELRRLEQQHQEEAKIRREELAARDKQQADLTRLLQMLVLERTPPSPGAQARPTENTLAPGLGPEEVANNNTARRQTSDPSGVASSDGSAEGDSSRSAESSEVVTKDGREIPQGPRDQRRFGPGYLPPYQSSRTPSELQHSGHEPGQMRAMEVSDQENRRRDAAHGDKGLQAQGWPVSWLEPLSTGQGGRDRSNYAEPPGPGARTNAPFPRRDQAPARNDNQGRPFGVGPPRPKMATFHGEEKDDWDAFFSSFERVAHRHQWSSEERLDRLHESLRGGRSAVHGLVAQGCERGLL